MKDSVEGLSSCVKPPEGNPVNFGGLPCFCARGEDLWPGPCLGCLPGTAQVCSG